MKYKTPELKDQLNNAHPKLKKMTLWLEQYCLDKYNKEIVITEVDRTRQQTIAIYIKEINPKTGKLYLPEEVKISPHETKPCRADDVRTGGMFTNDECLHLEYTINSTWIYDPDRLNMKCCKYHKVGDSASHLHLQVTDKTELVS